VWCRRGEFRFAVGGGLFEATVRVEELFAGFDVAAGQENHGKGGELEDMGDVREASKQINIHQSNNNIKVKSTCD
jgi:hypothetical protein